MFDETDQVQENKFNRRYGKGFQKTETYYTLFDYKIRSDRTVINVKISSLFKNKIKKM